MQVSSKNQRFAQRLSYALQGLRWAWRTEASFRVHCLGLIVLVAVLFIRRPEPHWWAILSLCAGLVMVSELCNTALEYLLDWLHPAHHPAVGRCKDVAAAAVLVASLVALVVFACFIWMEWQAIE